MHGDPHSQLAGRTLAGRYDILALIGVGGMGAVYRARDRELDELVALKVIRSDLAEDAEVVARFRHEVKLARRVTHANVARTFELGHADDLMFCTMELIEGESLTRRIARFRRLSVAEATTIASAVCDALVAAHAVDVIHRDIKPDNVLIAHGGRVVLADFGIASAQVDGGGDLSGTPAYMAPEQGRGEAPSPATDVYAVGLLLYEMLTGTRAFPGDHAQIETAKHGTERLLIPPTTDVDPKLADLIAAATAREVANRIPSAAALRAQLAGWATEAPPIEPVLEAPGVGDGVRTVIVFAPEPTTDRSRLYLAEAVHEQVLRRLGRLPQLRVLPRVGGTREAGATNVVLESGDELTVTVSSPGRGEVTVLRYPLAVNRLAEVAEALAAAISSTLAFDRTQTIDPSTEALDLLLQARHIGQRDVAQIGGAIEKLERARVLLPEDPRIAANLAILQVRNAFFTPDISTELLARSHKLVQVALAAGPRLAEAHLAAGHLELNVGDATVAAGHYRVAIACSPHLAEAHESLGRMLLEAGFIEDGLARISEAIAMRPTLTAIRFDIARAYALEERWEEHDVVLEELHARSFSAPSRAGPLRLRFAAWRRDHAAIAAICAEPDKGFDPLVFRASIEIYARGAWPQYRDVVVAMARDRSTSIRRRRALVAQLAAEAAGFSGDAEVCSQMIQVSIEHGLFDLHWLDRCPLLDLVRALPVFAKHRAIVKQRADVILDALYGDHDVRAMSDTVVASIP